MLQGSFSFGESKLTVALKYAHFQNFSHIKLNLNRKMSKSEEKRLALKKNRKDEKEKEEEKKEEEANKPEAIPWDTITYNVLIRVTGLPEPKKARFECEVCPLSIFLSCFISNLRSHFLINLEKSNMLTLDLPQKMRSLFVSSKRSLLNKLLKVCISFFSFFWVNIYF